MELTTVSLIISAVVAVVQVFNFWESRNSKKEDKLNIYSRAVDVDKKFDEIIVNIDTKIALYSSQNEVALTKLSTCQAVLKERIDNEIVMTSKALDKLNDELDRL